MISNIDTLTKIKKDFIGKGLSEDDVIGVFNALLKRKYSEKNNLNTNLSKDEQITELYCKLFNKGEKEADLLNWLVGYKKHKKDIDKINKIYKEMKEMHKTGIIKKGSMIETFLNARKIAPFFRITELYHFEDKESLSSSIKKWNKTLKNPSITKEEQEEIEIMKNLYKLLIKRKQNDFVTKETYHHALNLARDLYYKTRD